MNIKSFKYIAVAAVLGLGMTSCEDFLDRPTEDSYTADNYYASDAACIAGVNYLYNSPWYDFQRGFVKMGEVMSGNMYWGNSPYMNFSVNGTDVDLVNMSYSLWAEIGHCNTVYASLKNSSASESVKNQCMGECLVWKAMAYFYLVRTFGDVPIIHDNSEVIASEEYKTCNKVEKADVYDYIIMTLDEALKLMPRQKLTTGHIDYFCAEALLAKVYLTKAGLSGSLNNADLVLAAEKALDVIENSGRSLMENYEDIFRGSNNISDESLIAWRWTVGAQWTSQNTLQSDLMPDGFDEFGDCWGGWGGPSVDLMDAFDFDPLSDPSTRIETDVRRKATIMVPGDIYPYFWRDHDLGGGKSGFDILRFYYDKDYNKAATGAWQGPCGAQNVKHAYGNNADHQAEMGMSAGRMAYALATHILRLSDVYLIYAESIILQGKTSGDDFKKALKYFNAVRGRAVSGYKDKESLTYDDIWKERRLEFAGEADRWYDYVRRSYWDMDYCVNELHNQRRNQMYGMDDLYKSYFESGNWVTSGSTEDGRSWSAEYADPETHEDAPKAPNVTPSVFTLPFPVEDVALNPNLGSNVPAVHVDLSKYKY